MHDYDHIEQPQSTAILSTRNNDSRTSPSFRHATSYPQRAIYTPSQSPSMDLPAQTSNPHHTYYHYHYQNHNHTLLPTYLRATHTHTTTHSMSHPNPLGSNPPPVPWCDCGCNGDPVRKAEIAAERKARGESAAVHQAAGVDEKAEAP